MMVIVAIRNLSLFLLLHVYMNEGVMYSGDDGKAANAKKKNIALRKGKKNHPSTHLSSH